MSIRIEKAMKAAAGVGKKSVLVTLNVRQRCDEASESEQELFKRRVAQDEAALALSQIYQVYLAKMTLPGNPLGSLLFLGPTGSGKTRAVEAADEALFGDPHAMVKIVCAEFQHRQVASGEVVRVDVDDEAHELCFKKLSRSAMTPLNATMRL
jgi:ATP-dependent Clp protease ATP-binding subunit ClpA